MPNSLSSSALFTGQEDYALDEKGRVTVPARWRQKDVDSEPFHLVPDSQGACLRVMRPDRFAQFGEEIRSQPGMDPAKYRLFLRYFYANSMQVAADKQGRIMIPKDYCTRLGLTGTIRLVGCGDLFELWDQKGFLSREEKDLSEFSQLVGGIGL